MSTKMVSFDFDKKRFTCDRCGKKMVAPYCTVLLETPVMRYVFHYCADCFKEILACLERNN